MTELKLIPGKLYKMNKTLCYNRKFKTDVAMCLSETIIYSAEVIHQISCKCMEMLIDNKVEAIYMYLPMDHYFIEEVL